MNLEKHKKSSSRLRVRFPGEIDRFSARLAQALASAKLKPSALANILGFRQETISRLARGSAPTLPIDLLTKLAAWADTAGISIRWLVLGAGPMKKADLAPPSSLADQLNQAIAYPMLCILAERSGINVADIVPKWLIGIDRPGGGVGTYSVAEALQSPSPVESPDPSAAKKVEPGYRLVAAEDLPPNWKGKFVPLIGRLAAGEGIDTVEAEAHPPGWADTFVEYRDAPASAFAVRVVGDSMKPEYRQGDIVIADGAQPVQSGIACVIYDADDGRRARLKRLKVTKRTAVLESINADHPPVKLPATKVEAYRIIAHLPARLSRSVSL